MVHWTPEKIAPECQRSSPVEPTVLGASSERYRTDDGDDEKGRGANATHDPRPSSHNDLVAVGTAGPRMKTH